MKKVYEVADGKYRLERCPETYILWAYRQGEPWTAKTDSLVGDKLIHALLDKIDQLEDKLGGTL
jgi:hypothetical protein